MGMLLISMRSAGLLSVVRKFFQAVENTLCMRGLYQLEDVNVLITAEQ